MGFNKAYLDFLRYTIEIEAEIPASAYSIDWKNYLQYCNRQGIIGLVFDGLQRSDLRISQSVLFEWISFAESIKAQNKLINRRIIQTVDFLHEKDCNCVILKGQANGLMYPNPEMRSPGDIDVWASSMSDGRSKWDDVHIIRMVLKECPKAHYSIHHIKLPIFKDVSVEVHYRPIYMANWFADRKLQRYISNIEDKQFANKVSFEGGKIGCLTDDFNLVYQMLHMYHHFFETRNSFKQFIDYYYLLKKANSDNIDFKDTADRFRDFGVQKYASGVMWIMSNVLMLEKELPIEPNEKEGRLILKESKYFGTWSTNKFRSVIEQFAANIKIVTHYPKEVLISPIFLIWHQWWKVKMKWTLRRIGS